MKNIYKWLIGSLVTVFLLVFITIKMDCHTIRNDIISLKMKKRIIEDNIKVLKAKESQLISKNRIENIAIKEFGMYSPSPESLIVVINE
tara:strand:- start:457 stop:723 length:267 start_codon:yes stop_codon:yes gene_type:complete